MTPHRLTENWTLRLTAIFAVVHALYYLAGIRFIDTTLIEVMHFIDVELLKTRLLESVLYLHIQPPLFNLFVGLVFKVSSDPTWLFQGIFLTCGLVLYLNIFSLQLKFGVNARLAAFLATIFMASPSFILWEHFLLYTLPIATLLSIAALCLLSYLESRRTRPLVGFFLAIFVLCGIASMFHLGYFVLLFGALLVMSRGYRRQILAVGLVPLLVLFGFYFKNYLLFGEFNVCSFAEKNLWIMTAGNMPWDEKTKLVEEGKLSELSLINRWDALDNYPPKYSEVPERFRDIPVLATTHKTNGKVNYNHFGYIENCEVYGADAKYVLLHEPRHFIVSTMQSWYRYFKSSSDLPVAPENQQRIRPALAFYDHVIYGKFPFDLSPWSRLVEKTQSTPCVFLLAGLPLVFMYGLYRAARPGLSDAQRSTLAFIVLTIFMVAFLGCSLDYLETARYRFTTDGLSVVLLGVLVQSTWRGWRGGGSDVVQALGHGARPLQ
ncbi:MAG: hypothetical protein JNK74_12495 [Candidatus Hydrogenedentes bacterium]|nr:hypothetical protein [Candidatus Hydrogenedentota bacterium]